MFKKVMGMFLSISIILFSSNSSSEIRISEIQRSEYLFAHYIYAAADLNNIIKKSVFLKAATAYKRHNTKSKKLVIIDYTIPSNRKRFFVIDMEKKKLLFVTYAAHGLKSDINNYAGQFSNIDNSNQSSLGIFITAETYIGKNGYSLRLDGLEPGYNDNIRKRNIVIHGADYSERSFIKKNKYAGLSEGCPAIPKHISRKIIDEIKEGTIVYSFGIDVDEYNFN